MMRKVGMVFIVVGLATEGVQIQALSALLLLCLMLVMTYHSKPFEVAVVDMLEKLSLLTSLFTLWLGCFFWTGRLTQAGEVSVTVFLGILNFSYLVFFFSCAFKEIWTDSLASLASPFLKFCRRKRNPDHSSQSSVQDNPMQDNPMQDNPMHKAEGLMFTRTNNVGDYDDDRGDFDDDTAGWSTHFDPVTSQKYEFHSVTGESRWKA
jgi:hypothetical protein